MKKTVLVPIAPGIEEIEAVTIIDVLRRAGAEVVVASVADLQIVASRGVKLTADKRIADCARSTFDLIALPGGMPGAEHLRDSAELVLLLKAISKRPAASTPPSVPPRPSCCNITACSKAARPPATLQWPKNSPAPPRPPSPPALSSIKTASPAAAPARPWSLPSSSSNSSTARPRPKKSPARCCSRE